MTEPTETFALGPYTLRVIRKEIVLGERMRRTRTMPSGRSLAPRSRSRRICSNANSIASGKEGRAMSIDDIDLRELRAMWRRRRRAAEHVRKRIDPTGMTRPARSPEEHEWLREKGEESVFVEVERSDGNPPP